MDTKLSEVDFTRKAIKALRTKSKDGTREYKGIHTVYSGFNGAFKAYFEKDPVEAVSAMVVAGTIVGHPAKGGYYIGLPEDNPNAKAPSVIIAKILA
jgi:hypothetical protein